jgi:hypothetical protein
VDLITGPELYAHVAPGQTASAEDAAFAVDVAAAVNAATTRLLEVAPEVEPLIVDGTWEGLPDLHVAALEAGSARWKRREAPFGIAGFDVQGGAVRLAADDMKPIRAAVDRWHRSAGYAIA